MRVVHEDALICDFAQFYHVYDIDELDVRTAAILTAGLPKESRLVKKLTGNKPDQETILMASILDTVRNIEYAVFQAHSKKKLQKPQSVMKKLLGIDDNKKQNNLREFRSADEFEIARKNIISR